MNDPIAIGFERRNPGYLTPTHGLLLSIGVVVCVILATWAGQRLGVRAVIEGVNASNMFNFKTSCTWLSVSGERTMESSARVSTKEQTHAWADVYMDAINEDQRRDPILEGDRK